MSALCAVMAAFVVVCDGLRDLGVELRGGFLWRLRALNIERGDRSPGGVATAANVVGAKMLRDPAHAVPSEVTHRMANEAAKRCPIVGIVEIESGRRCGEAPHPDVDEVALCFSCHGCSWIARRSR